MPLEAGAIGFAALACFTLAMPKHRAQLTGGATLSPRVARGVGLLLLVIALATAIRRFGLTVGVVAWIGQLSVAAVLLVLLMSWRPKYTLPIAVVALACTPLMGF